MHEPDTIPSVADRLSAAIAAHRAGKIDEARALYVSIVAESENAVALTNLGSIARSTGQVAQAEALYRRALKVDPNRATARFNLGHVLTQTGQLDEAARLYRSVREAIPEATFELANVLLAMGCDEEGWRLYDERPGRIKAVAWPLSFPEWQGEPLEGKRLLIRPEQGFGDQILAARYIPQLAAAHVSYYVTAPLVTLLEQLCVEVHQIGSHDIPVEAHDYWTLPLSLPRWASPVSPPYLCAAPFRTGRRIGLAWRGNALPDPARSMPDEAAASLLALPEAISLHPTEGQDFKTTAQIIAGLDLVISIDTSIAHLAGAMGKPLWLLLHHGSHDWRWRTIRPFYSDVRIFRQRSPGDWTAVINDVHTALAAYGRSRES